MCDYVAEQTEIDRDVAEMILAHTVGNAVEKAQRSGIIRIKSLSYSRITLEVI